MVGLIIGLSLLTALLAVIAVVVIRTLNFKPEPEQNCTPAAVHYDIDKAFSDLGEMIKCKTVSHNNQNEDDEAEFDKFKTLLPHMFPNIFKNCEYTEVSSRALLFKLKGEKSNAPTVLMAHFDVVSVNEEQWSKPPFEAIVEDDVLWGRGTLDTKVTLNAAMQALECKLNEGYIPKQDLYLAFAGDEEVNGGSAMLIVDMFEKQGITPGLVLDEGGAVVENVFPGVKRPAALIGIAEKGLLNVEFISESNGGHSSAPKPHTPVGHLSAACARVENNPFKFKPCEASVGMFKALARNSNFLYRMIFANLGLFSPVLNLICKKSGGEMNALVRTTCAFTQMEGSSGMNVIPPRARMVANLRIIPGETADSAIEYLKATIKNNDIKINKIYANNPSVMSLVDCEAYERVKSAVADTWCDAIVSPYLMVACSDSRHWGRISNKVYRFSAMALSNEERATIHGNDERVPKQTVGRAVEFYLRVLKSC